MRKLAFALALLAAPLSAQSVERPSANAFGAPIVVSLDAIPTSGLVTMLLRDVMQVPYVIAPDVLSDRRPTSVKLVIPRNDVPNRVVTYLRRSGFVVDLVGGTVYVSRGGRHGAAAPFSSYVNAPVPMGSPLDGSLSSPEPVLSNPRFRGSDETEGGSSPGPVADIPTLILAYIPAHRDPAYLSGLVGSVIPGIVFGARGEVKAQPEQQSIAPEAGPDVLVMAGSADELRRARQLVTLLDRPRPLVAVKAVVMQMQDLQVRGSALSVLARFADGKVTVGSNVGAAPGTQFVRIATGAVSAMLTAVREDSRFRVVATPNLTALSGATASMNAGSQVPTVGAVVTTEGGAPVQSIVYRDSGITLSIRPVVRGDLIEMEVRQERSTFVPTTTGVEDSPTLQKSSVMAQVMLKNGESVALAGLTESSEGRKREGLFGGLLGVRGRDQSESELVVLLSADIVPSPAAPPGEFFDLKAEETTDELAPTQSPAPVPGRA